MLSFMFYLKKRKFLFLKKRREERGGGEKGSWDGITRTGRTDCGFDNRPKR